MGFLRPTVNVDIQLSNIVAMDSFDFAFTGKSMGAGIDGSAKVELVPEESAIRVKIGGAVETSGLLSKVSDSKIENAVEGFLDEYFGSIERSAL